MSAFAAANLSVAGFNILITLIGVVGGYNLVFDATDRARWSGKRVAWTLLPAFLACDAIIWLGVFFYLA